MKQIASILTLISLVGLSGCAQEKSEPASATSATTAAEKVATLPEGFFLASAPANAVPLSQARANAKPGEAITLTGYIGGRVEPFTQGRAVFLVVDSEKAPQCVPEHGCKTPWDACCEESTTIAANSATIQVVDAEGKTLRLDMNGQKGLAPGSVVTVVGKIREANESVLIVDASAIAIGSSSKQ